MFNTHPSRVGLLAGLKFNSQFTSKMAFSATMPIAKYRTVGDDRKETLTYAVCPDFTFADYIQARRSPNEHDTGKSSSRIYLQSGLLVKAFSKVTGPNLPKTL